MNCKNCGFQLQNGDMFCKNCGAKTEDLGGTNMANGPVIEPVQPNIMPNTQEVVQPTLMPNMQEPVQPTPMANDYIQPQPQPMPMPNSYVPPQPSMMQQQGQPNMMGGAPMQSGYNNSGTKSKSIYVIIGLVVAVIALVVVLVLKTGSTSSGSSGGGSVNGGKVVTNQTYSVNFQGFKFKIPTNYLYEKGASSIFIGDEESTWAFYIEVMKVPFSQIQANKNQLTLGFKNAGYSASNLNQKTYGGLDFITVELAKGGEKAVAGITKANSMYSFGITAVNASRTIDYNILTKAAEILKTAEYSDVSNSIKINSEIDLSQIIQSLNENTNPEVSVDDATVPVE